MSQPPEQREQQYSEDLTEQTTVLPEEYLNTVRQQSSAEEQTTAMIPTMPPPTPHSAASSDFYGSEQETSFVEPVTPEMAAAYGYGPDASDDGEQATQMVPPSYANVASTSAPPTPAVEEEQATYHAPPSSTPPPLVTPGAVVASPLPTDAPVEPDATPAAEPEPAMHSAPPVSSAPPPEPQTSQAPLPEAPPPQMPVAPPAQQQAPQHMPMQQAPEAPAPLAHPPVPVTQQPVSADAFAQRREHNPPAPKATMGLPAFVRRLSFGLITPELSRKEKEHREAVRKVRRNFGGLRQITVVNPKGGAGKTCAVLMTSMTFGQNRGGYVLAWDNNETQGTLGMRAQPDFHTHTVRDVLTQLDHFRSQQGRVGDLMQFVRSQGEAMFDVLASDESATAGEMLTAEAFSSIREIVDRFYKLIIVDTGNNVRAENWQQAIDVTNQLMVTMSARGDSAETAARMLDHLEQTGRGDLARNAVTVISMPATKKGLDLPAIQRHFEARTRAVHVAPYEPLLDSGEPIEYEAISSATREAWLRICASLSE